MKTETKRKIRIVGRILFILYLLALVYFLFLAEGYGRVDMQKRDYQYNLELFREIRRFWVYRHKVGLFAAFLNIGGNVIGFLPFGFILPVMHRNMNRFWLVTLLGFSLSLLVESVQLVCRVGSFDVDDLLLNTVGAALGYIAFAVCDKIRRIHYEKV